MLKRLHKREDGDTIVEVLISLAILALILGGAYYTANLSLRNDEDSQEHTEALTIAQSQLEDLRSYGTSFSQSYVATEDNCFNGSDAPVQNACEVCSSNDSQIVSSCPTSTPYYFTVNVKPYCTPPTDTSCPVVLNDASMQTYRVLVTWPPLAGTGASQDQVELFYRLDS